MFTKSLIKTIGNFFLIATLCAFIGSNVYADDPRVTGDNVDIDVKANISSIFVVEPGDAVLFGDIQLPANGAGTVTLGAVSGIIDAFDGDIVAVEGPDIQAGTVTYIAPVPGQITVTYPPALDLTNVDSGDIITYSPESDQFGNGDVIDIAGYNEAGTVRMGGVLDIPADSDEGEYTGVLNIQLDRI
jgi:hypothetical protein